MKIVDVIDFEIEVQVLVSVIFRKTLISEVIVLQVIVMAFGYMRGIFSVCLIVGKVHAEDDGIYVSRMVSASGISLSSILIVVIRLNGNKNYKEGEIDGYLRINVDCSLGVEVSVHHGGIFKAKNFVSGEILVVFLTNVAHAFKGQIITDNQNYQESLF